MQKNALLQKLRLTSKFMALQTSKPMTTIHLLPNISRSKGNQTMTFGHLIEHNIRNIFLEKSYKKYPGETIHNFTFIAKAIISRL